MATISSTIRIVDAFSAPLDKLSSGLAKSQSGFNKLKNSLTGNVFSGASKQSGSLFKSMVGGTVVGGMINNAMGAVSNGIHSMIGELNEASTSWQTFEGNMNQIGKSPAQIAAAKKDMQQFAQQTIYSASDMSNTYSQLAAVGIKNTGQLVKGFGGLAAAATNPSQAMKTLSEQATQMAAKPKAQWADFKLMMEQSPAGMAAVAKTMGTDLNGLIQKIQAGEVSSKSLLNAIAKTGTNTNFSKMATQYKTVGQAMDGLKETLANKLQPAFDKVGKVGIDAISKITDSLDNVSFEKLGDTLANGLRSAIEILTPIIKSLGTGIKQIFEGFNDSGAISNIKNAFATIADSVNTLLSSTTNFSGGSFFTELGEISGTAVSGVANALAGISRVLGSFNTAQLELLAAAFVSLKFGLKGLALAGVVAALGQLNSVDPGTLTGIATAITTLASAFAAFKIVGEVSSVVTEITSAFSQIRTAITSLVTGLSTIGAAVGVGLAPIAIIVVAITAVIIGAVMAWQDNFMGFRDVMTGIFSNLGQIFSPLISAIQNLGQAIQPVAGVVLPMLKGALEGISAGVILAIALAIGVFADALTSVISIATAVVSAIKAIVQGFHALGDALTGNFSGAKRDIEDAKNAVSSLGDALGHVGHFDNTANIMGQFSKIKFGAQDTASSVNSTKMSPKVDTSTANAQLASLGNKTIPAPKVEQPKFNMSNPFQSLISQSQSTKIPAPQVEQPKMPDTSSITSKLQSGMPKTLPGPTIQQPKVEGGGNLTSQITNSVPKTLPAPKVEQPTVPSPKLSASVQTIPAPKVGTPVVPTPKMPSVLATIPAPKVGTPVVPQPTMPTITATIPAPHVGTPNMSGVVSAVSSGMAAAAGAAIAGGAALVSAVRSAVNQAVAAARSAAGAMRAAGVMIGAGLAQGMWSQVGAVAAAANALVAQANRAARAKAQIHSPSRLFAEVGDYIGQGLAKGMEGTTGLVSNASSGMIEEAELSVPSITPESVPTSSTSNTTDNSTAINIEEGAIVIQGSGNTETDADTLISILERRIIELKNKAL